MYILYSNLAFYSRGRSVVFMRLDNNILYVLRVVFYELIQHYTDDWGCIKL